LRTHARRKQTVPVTSVFDVFTVGIGPSSSHTVGPMRAANLLTGELARTDLSDVRGLRVELLGSLGATGRGHGSDRAVLAGLAGHIPATVDPGMLDALVADIRARGVLTLRTADGRSQVDIAGFDIDTDVVFDASTRLAYHPNALRFTVRTASGVRTLVYYSVGGGRVLADDGAGAGVPTAPDDVTALPYPFTTGEQLAAQCARHGLCVAEVAMRDEMARGRDRAQIRSELAGRWQVMRECIKAGTHTEGILPGGLGVRRRAPGLARQLKHETASTPISVLDWVSLWALATGEQNAAGARMVTAPTNGAAGIVPAVLMYAHKFIPGCDADTTAEFLLAAGAICSIYTATASISGAEVGCQGEIGVACSMAAAGLTQVLGGSARQVLNAAEIGMEHHLGLTCDPVGGLVQVPCIERNAIGAATAITAARLALAGDGRQIVSLDQVIATMMATGADMRSKYKETAQGGLALSIAAC
jgi:L-serine dehydratase